jgi:hypothetical protein
MIGHELAIEQFKAARFHPRYQPCKRHFGGIGGAAKHAFAKKGAAHCKPVQPTDQLTIQPTFHAMRMARRVQRKERLLNIRVDPGLRPVCRCLRACLDHLRKCRVAGYLKAFLPDYLRQRP